MSGKTVKKNGNDYHERQNWLPLSVKEGMGVMIRKWQELKLI